MNTLLLILVVIVAYCYFGGNNCPAVLKQNKEMLLGVVVGYFMKPYVDNLLYREGIFSDFTRGVDNILSPIGGALVPAPLVQGAKGLVGVSREGLQKINKFSNENQIFADHRVMTTKDKGGLFGGGLFG